MPYFSVAGAAGAVHLGPCLNSGVQGAVNSNNLPDLSTLLQGVRGVVVGGGSSARRGHAGLAMTVGMCPRPLGIDKVTPRSDRARGRTLLWCVAGTRIQRRTASLLLLRPLTDHLPQRAARPGAGSSLSPYTCRKLHPSWPKNGAVEIEGT